MAKQTPAQIRRLKDAELKERERVEFLRSYAEHMEIPQHTSRETSFTGIITRKI